MTYQKIIQAEAEKMDVDVDPRHVEAWMRLEWKTLDGLSLKAFQKYIRVAIEEEAYDPGSGERLAKTYAL